MLELELALSLEHGLEHGLVPELVHVLEHVRGLGLLPLPTPQAVRVLDSLLAPHSRLLVEERVFL